MYVKMAELLEKRAEYDVIAHPGQRRKPSSSCTKFAWTLVISILIIASSLYYRGLGQTKGDLMRLLDLGTTQSKQQLTRKYDLQIGSRWMNPGEPCNFRKHVKYMY